MKVVSVIAQKGGSGKTTLSLATACAATAEGLSTIVIDLDPQATATSWGDRRRSGAPTVVPAQPPRLGRILEAAAGQGVELAVLDTAPRVEQSAIAAAKAADLVIVPCRPAVYDLETVGSTLEVIRAVAPNIPAICVLNGVPPRGPRQEQARQLLADIGIDVCPTSLGLRAVIDYAAAAGVSAQEHEPHSKAAAEVSRFYKFICELVDLSASRHPDTPNPRQVNLSSSGQSVPAAKLVHAPTANLGQAHG